MGTLGEIAMFSLSMSRTPITDCAVFSSTSTKWTTTLSYSADKIHRTISWSSFGSYDYTLAYDAGTEIIADDNPKHVNKVSNMGRARMEKEDPRWKVRFSRRGACWLKRRIFFYVRKSIPVSDWAMATYNNANTYLVATLQLTTLSGEIFLHNVYNQNLDLIASTCLWIVAVGQAQTSTQATTTSTIQAGVPKIDLPPL